MRELEFLPAWYPQTRRRRRLVVIQAWLTVATGCALALWVALSHRNIMHAELSLVDLQEQLNQSQVQLRQMNELKAQRDQLLKQQLILSKLGLQVEPSRILRMLETLMPRDMALLHIQLEAEEHSDPAALQTRLMPAGDLPIDRHLHVRIQGVAPNDSDVSNFTTQLIAVPFFEDVAISYARERSDNGRVLREFEVTFAINLNMPVRS
jgi:hypothetical protein